ncbi:unnamed protein product [Microthlaspi erraticum]|uniref:Pectinesterase inhibitor domain-containing protein n=1 Tax=Microthlaspi erraticum TaxID=1685480 RepID=A0A6D2IFB0_9BRAS|nr:unnamed protein product [Microthlaspi erraticum]
MKFFVSFVMCLLLLNGFTTAQNLILDSCKKASARDAQLKLDFCVQSLESDPQSKAATTLEGLVIASAKSAASKTISVKGTIQRILNDKKASAGIEMILRDCVELYGDATDSINEALTSVPSGDYDTVKVNLSAALDAPANCEDGFMEKRHQKSPFANEGNICRLKILIPLAFTNML